MLNWQAYWKGNQQYFWAMQYPQQLEDAGFKDKTIGFMIRFGMREDAREYIQEKKKERAAV